MLLPVPVFMNKTPLIGLRNAALFVYKYKFSAFGVFLYFCSESVNFNIQFKRNRCRLGWKDRECEHVPMCECAADGSTICTLFAFKPRMHLIMRMLRLTQTCRRAGFNHSNATHARKTRNAADVTTAFIIAFLSLHQQPAEFVAGFFAFVAYTACVALRWIETPL